MDFTICRGDAYQGVALCGQHVGQGDVASLVSLSYNRLMRRGPRLDAPGFLHVMVRGLDGAPFPG